MKHIIAGRFDGVKPMTRILAVLATTLVLSPIASAGPKVTITWHGQSFFDVQSSKGTRIALDPHAIEAFGRQDIPADVVLISHEHSDHNQTGVIRNEAQARVIHGIKVDGRKTTWNNVDETFRDIHIRSVGVYHDAAEGMERGKNTIFILEVDGLHIVHLGDLGHLLTPKDIKRIGPVDVLMIPVGGVYALNGSEAKKVVEQLKPRLYILPMHYATGTFQDLLPLDEFLEDQKNVRKLPGSKLLVDPDAKADSPEIVILDWKN
jgi:L-ascorbate metabolism protein UlaG (beta-lactamase superfamily)